MLTKLDLECLGSIADDYEEIPQIKVSLKVIDKIEASESEISVSLSKLIASKLALAYEYDESKSDYTEVQFFPDKVQVSTNTWRPGESTSSRMWFYITSAGLDYLRQNEPPEDCRNS
jgi:hypothetical protein